MEFLNPEEVLKKLDLKEDMVACDFGSGSGGWALPLARILTEGKDYAIDILEEPLSALKGKAETSRIQNIKTIQSDVEKKGGSGIKTAKVTPKTGNLIALSLLRGEEEDLIVISQIGQVIRTKISSIPILGRPTQGVRIMKLEEGDRVASATCI